jgi:hypothetical protein
MGIPFFKTKKNTVDFSRDFYEQHLFSSKFDVGGTYAQVVHSNVCKADTEFARVQLSKLKDEMLGLQLEMIGTAWTHKSKENAAIATSEFTKRYLAHKERTDLWEIMGEYNQIVASSTTYGSKPDTPGGRAHIAFTNSMRMDIFDGWIKKGHDEEAVARVVNRLMSETSWNKGITPVLLGTRMMFRLNVESEAIAQSLAAIAFGFYQGAKESLDGVKLTA